MWSNLFGEAVCAPLPSTFHYCPPTFNKGHACPLLQQLLPTTIVLYFIAFKIADSNCASTSQSPKFLTATS